MSVADFLNFIFKYNDLLIEALIAAILVIAGLLTYRLFSAAKEEELGHGTGHGGGADMANIEAMMKSLLEKAGQVPSPSVTGAAGGDAAATELSGQIAKLKQELETKKAEIEAIKKAAPAGAAASADGSGGVSAEDKSALEAKLKELQAKLDEFDIISQDIADLSFYKEENQRLQKELDAAKKAGGAAPAAAPAAAAAPTAAPATATPAAESAPVATPSAPAAPADAAPATTPTPSQAPAPADPNAPPADIIAPKNDQVMEAFATAVTQQQVAPAAEPGTGINVAGTEVVSDDLVQEFEAAVAEQKGSDTTKVKGTAPKPEGSQMVSGGGAEAAPADGLDIALDLDKMVSEVVALPEVPEGAEVKNSLIETLDPEKLAAEANDLNGVPPESQELMGEFEQFVKKGK